MTAGNLVLFAVSLVVMLLLSPLLTVVALLVGPALYLVALASRRRLFPASWDAQQQSGAVAGVVEAAVTGVRVVKGFGQEEQELDRLEEASRRLFASRVRTVRLMARYSPALQAIPAFGQIGVLALGGWLAIHGSITLGTFLAFSSYLAQLVGPVRMLTDLITLGQQARASVIRVFEVIDSRPLITEQPDATGAAAPTRPGSSSTTFTSATAGAAGAARPVAAGRAGRDAGDRRRVRLRASPPWRCCCPGSTTCTRARSGSAGTTSGTSRSDSLRAAIGMVFEDSFLFSDTVRANIAYGRPDATDDAGRRGGAGRRGRRVHHRAAGRLRHRRRRAGADPVRRPAAADRAGPRAAHRPPDPACSTTPRPRSTRGSRRRSTPRCAG